MSHEAKPALDVRKVALIGIIVAFGAAVWWDMRQPVEAPAATPEIAGAQAASPERERRRLDPHQAAIVLASREAVHLASRDLRVGKMVVLDLGIPRSEEPVENLDVRVTAPNGRSIQARAVMPTDRHTTARVQVQAGWLKAPGRYIVSVAVPGKPSIASRRYPIIVE